MSGGSLRLAGDQLSDLAPFRSFTGRREVRGWLAASLTALDGSQLGAIQIFDDHPRNFAEDDEAARVHLAQMASATVERAALYQRTPVLGVFGRDRSGRKGERLGSLPAQLQRRRKQGLGRLREAQVDLAAALR